MAIANNNLNKNRGLDPHAMKVLEMRKKKRQEQDSKLKRQQVERELNSLRSRISVLDREIERLSVTERRSRGEVVRTEQELQDEIRDVLELTKELGEHEGKIKKLESMLGAKQGTLGRLRSIVSRTNNDSGGRELKRLKDELKKVESEIEQLDNKRRRLISEMNQVQNKAQKQYDTQSKMSSEIEISESEMNKIMEEMRAEKSIFDRLHARFGREQREALQKQKQVQDIKNRFRGADSGIPSLESEKMRLEQKIKQLEKELN